MQKSIVSQNMAHPSLFPLPNRVQYLPVFVYSLRTSSLVTLSSQLIFSILLHKHISKASNLLLSVCVNVHVSAAYNATLQTKHFIILFFSSRFTLPINSFFFSINTFFIELTHLLSININFLFIHLETDTEDDVKGPPILFSEFNAALNELKMERQKEKMEYRQNC